MKLKKIASLMLAGIMAVSMLAGCKDAASSSTPAVPETPVDTSFASALNDELTDEQKNIFTFEASSELDSVLNDIAYTLDVSSVSGNFLTGAGLNNFRTLVDASTTVNAIGSEMKTVSKAGDVKGANLLILSGEYTEKGLANAVYNSINGYFNSTNYPVGSASFDISYKANVAVVKVDNIVGTASKYVVAITVTQTAVAVK